ncbi:MAG: hypothetical protein KKF46_08280 [Nanoarchaeota archaeon]|nr:hypothetical protein [Nanoarchaeota archaeon]MBU1322326.1 hypothetical protein [Nanoarchaeota archaeon]MBU1598154.1 hypothetical protein [Nanoarchaeota archaeon]
MYTPTMPIRLPNPGLPPEGFPPMPDRYKRIDDLVEFPNKNKDILSYKIILPKFDKDRSTGHNIDYNILKLVKPLENHYVH